MARAKINLYRLQAYTNQGKSAQEIAEIFHCTTNTVWRLQKKHNMKTDANGVPKPPRFDWNIHGAEALRLHAQGLSYSKIAKALNAPSRESVGSFIMNRVRMPDPKPPSQAMIRLAEFDPVIRRALRRRLGLKYEREEGEHG